MEYKKISSKPKPMEKVAMLLIVLMLFMLPASFGQRVRYSGLHHTTSHGGSYRGGHGSSHKGGRYVNRRTNNHYGRHKR